MTKIRENITPPDSPVKKTATPVFSGFPLKQPIIQKKGPYWKINFQQP
jgi:hypothetical protein